jgi:hypothetical protein
VRKIYRRFRPLPLPPPPPPRELTNIEKIAELITDEGVPPKDKKIPVLGIPTWWTPDPGFNPAPAEIKLKRWSSGPGYNGRVQVKNDWENRLGLEREIRENHKRRSQRWMEERNKDV